MCDIFGRSADDNKNDDQVEVDENTVLYDKSFMLTDFRMLSYHGNQLNATGLRGSYYLVLSFATS
jgi:hypothetical protein